MRWFTRPVFIFSRLKNTPLKGAVGKGKSKRMLSFLFVDKGRLFAKFSIYGRSERLDRLETQPSREAGKVLKNFQVYFDLYPRKLRF